MRAPFQILAIPYRTVNGVPTYCVLHRADCHQWQFIAGGGEDGETPLAAALRETLEEGGVTSEHWIALKSMAYLPVTVISPSHRQHWSRDTYVIPEHAFGFACSEELKLSREHTACAWLTYEEAMQRLIWDSNRTALYELDRRLKEESEITEDFLLIRPTVEYADQIAEYRREFLDAGNSMDGTGVLKRMEDPEEFIRVSIEREDSQYVPENLVPATQFLFVRKSDHRLVGMLQVRHCFNDYLEKYSGHVGYSVRPGERCRGYAKKMLRMALPYCRALGLQRILISCAVGNVGSEKTILANGGIYESTVYEPNSQRELKRFWISL